MKVITPPEWWPQRREQTNKQNPQTYHPKTNPPRFQSDWKDGGQEWLFDSPEVDWRFLKTWDFSCVPQSGDKAIPRHLLLLSWLMCFGNDPGKTEEWDTTGPVASLKKWKSHDQIWGNNWESKCTHFRGGSRSTRGHREMDSSNLTTPERSAQPRDSYSSPASPPWGSMGKGGLHLVPSGHSLAGKTLRATSVGGGNPQLWDNGKWGQFSWRQTLIPSENCVSLHRNPPAQSGCAHPSWATTHFVVVMPCLCPGRKWEEQQVSPWQN